MRNFIIILFIVIIIAVAYYFLIYKKKVVSTDGNPCSTTGGAIDGFLINGVCVKSEVPIPPALNVSDYFVNGDPAHDRDVFMKGLACAKAFLYKNNTDLMANNITLTIALSKRSGGDKTACQTIRVNCTIAEAINNLNTGDIETLNNSLYNINLNADTEWKRYANMAVGHKNMCSVILEEAFKTSFPNKWATLGRG